MLLQNDRELANTRD